MSVLRCRMTFCLFSKRRSLLRPIQSSFSRIASPLCVSTARDRLPRTLIILVDVRSAFWRAQTDLGGNVPFQVSLSCDPLTSMSQLRFSSLQLTFSDNRPDLVISAGEDEKAAVESYIDIGAVGLEEQERHTASLTWAPGSRIVLSGQLRSDQEGETKVSTAYCQRADSRSSPSRCP
jgi:hypothetical protein